MGGNEKKVASSFVVRTGPLKSAGLQELVMNLRKIMEPHTASKLKVLPLQQTCPLHAFFYDTGSCRSDGTTS